MRLALLLLLLSFAACQSTRKPVATKPKTVFPMDSGPQSNGLYSYLYFDDSLGLEGEAYCYDSATNIHWHHKLSGETGKILWHTCKNGIDTAYELPPIKSPTAVGTRTEGPNSPVVSGNGNTVTYGDQK